MLLGFRQSLIGSRFRREGFRLNWQSTVWMSPTGTAGDVTLAAYGEVGVIFKGLPYSPNG